MSTPDKKKTKIAIIGNPVSHSLSPIMQNAAFEACALPYRYNALKLTASELSAFFKKLKNSAYAGVNVTIPYKESAVKFMNELSDEAKLIGAVNTVVVKENRLIGHNTDGKGYLQSLTKEKPFLPKGRRIVILGAGGAARAILAALCQAGVSQITIVNRTLARAKKLSLEFQKKFSTLEIGFAPLDVKTLEGVFEETDLLVNATSAGLNKDSFPELPLKHLPRHAIVSDIVYTPQVTPLLKAAKKQGLKIHYGLGMLLYQGVLSFELWTGRKSPVAVMRKALQKELVSEVEV